MKMLITLEEKVRPDHTAVLLIDYQNEFCHDDGIFAKAGFDVRPFRSIESHLVRLVDGARKAGVPVVWIRNTYSTEKNNYLSPAFMEHAIRRWNGRYSKIPVCAEGSWGHDFYGRVQPKPGEAVIEKHRYDAFVGTDLEVVLRAKSIQTVIACGITTNMCVETTVRHACCIDYYVVVPTDAVAHWEKEAHDGALKNMEYGFAQLSSVDEIVRLWSRSG